MSFNARFIVFYHSKIDVNELTYKEKYKHTFSIKPKLNAFNVVWGTYQITTLPLPNIIPAFA